MVLCIVDDSTVMTIDSSNNLDISTRTKKYRRFHEIHRRQQPIIQQKQCWVEYAM
ncbi:hypothetical protein T07_6691 [Trichinella nelsoni]|uniref:Uncharacterized protein n=2 Tax=Trichinella TaxID=6333 RepID=A0A0V0RNT6_9BILA|nr:hypothetical protein T07_6691 [Trichinella nelsoni]KRY29951.1 hypothetical protein T01_11150 [Trichinella spiralis]